MSVIQFIVPKTSEPEAPEPEWISVFDNTYWQNQANASWDGTKWVESGPPADMVLVYKSGTTWREGFRPTKIRITGAFGYGGTVRVIDNLNGAGPYIAEGVAAASLEMDCDFDLTSDIYRLDLYGYTNVTNIEFLDGTLG
jgi:hypothetical protein